MANKTNPCEHKECQSNTVPGGWQSCRYIGNYANISSLSRILNARQEEIEILRRSNKRFVYNPPMPKPFWVEVIEDPYDGDYLVTGRVK